MIITRIGLILIIIAASITSLSINDASSDERVVYIGIVPFHGPEKIWRLYSPFVEYLNSSTSIKWELKIYASHEAIEKSLCKNELSIAFLGPLLAYKTHKECGAVPILTALNENGKVSFRVIIVTADRKLKSVNDLVGQKIGLFKPYTAARAAAKKMLAEEGISEVNAQLVSYQTLERLLDEVMTGSIKAGGVRDATLKNYKNFKFKELKVSEPLPGFVFAASSNASEDVKKSFTNALLMLRPLLTPKDKTLVRKWDEVIKYGFALPPKDYTQELEKYYLQYGSYIR